LPRSQPSKVNPSVKKRENVIRKRRGLEDEMGWPKYANSQRQKQSEATVFIFSTFYFPDQPSIYTASRGCKGRKERSKTLDYIGYEGA